MDKKILVVVAGSTQHTVMCAQALRQDPGFEVTAIITPEPKLVGRKQILTANPLHSFATENNIPVILVTKKIDLEIKHQVLKLDKPGFLMVVDFGYIVPDWMLEWPKLAPVNIHPSLLPRWRGSSPGQFTMLYGELTSAVTLMIMDSGLDTGPLLSQINFSVDPSWTHSEYYHHAFALISAKLPDLLTQFADGKLSPQAQPAETPTPLARRLDKIDGFVSWELVQAGMKGENPEVHELTPEQISDLLSDALTYHKSLAKTLYFASRALNPWPSLWTVVPTSKGEKRMKILSTLLDANKLVLETVHIEGKQPTTWNEVKNSLN